MRFLTGITIIFILINCNPQSNKWDIRGSWYSIDYGRTGHYDTARNYGELHVSDSIIQVFDEIPGELSPQSYYIRKDSVYKCFATGPGCEFIPMYKIKELKRDTLWLMVNPKWSKKQETYWVRLPKGEKGYYDHEWTKENSDSLEEAVWADYDRRTFRYFRTAQEYDSALKGGRWTWTMKDVKAMEELSKPTISTK